MQRYASYLEGDLNDVQIAPPHHTDTEVRNLDQNEMVKQVVRLITNECLRHEHKNLLHDTIFIPAIQQFALFLRPWLLILSSIFLLLLIVGIVQLVLLVTRRQILTNPHQHNNDIENR